MLMGAAGPGKVTLIWFTIRSEEDFYLKKLLLRTTWDGEEHPSVEVPVGDFFGPSPRRPFLAPGRANDRGFNKKAERLLPDAVPEVRAHHRHQEREARTHNLYFNIDDVTGKDTATDLLLSCSVSSGDAQ